MVEVNDRRESQGSGDFNNPSGTYSLVTHSDNLHSRWTDMSAAQARAEVHKYYAGQKTTKTWTEATRLAKSRTDHQARKWGFDSGADYANAYQGHLVNVMSYKGPGLAENFGEIGHRQSGYGRT